jgi:hypothetical protein
MYPEHRVMLKGHRGMGIATKMHRSSASYMQGGAVKKIGGAVKKSMRKPLSFRF